MSDTILGMNRSNVLTVAGLAGAALIGYAIYFDKQRRSAPDYKQKIRQKRREAAAARSGRPMAGGGMPSGGIPDPSDATAMQSFFLQEVQLGEELMSSGQCEEGAIHICNAIALCGQSQQLLQIFQQTLPPEQFALVIQHLPGTRERLSSMFGGGMPGGLGPDADEAAADAAGMEMHYGGEHPTAEIREMLDDEELE